MYKFGKAKKINYSSFRFRVGVIAFLLGTVTGYIFTGDNLTAAQMISWSERVKTVLFVRNLPARKDG